MEVKYSNPSSPQWKSVIVKTKMPQRLTQLEEIARNMWWTWNVDATRLFRDTNPQAFEKYNKNALDMLYHLSYEELDKLSNDENYMNRVNMVYEKFSNYMNEKPDSNRASVVYLCMEYGLNHFLKIYSGGLGILAGDYLKQASDSNVDMIAVGLLYRYGYFTQEIAMDGSQIAKYEAQDFERLPVERVLEEDGRQMVIDVPFPGYNLHAQVWLVKVGRIKLYLFDTDTPLNSEYDRPVTHALYGGDWENRLKQEVLLGIGGVMLMDKLGIQRDVFHCNEGHAALCNVQRLLNYVKEGMNFNQALELVRASSLYTVHTPVPAGHDYFDEGLFKKYLGAIAEQLGISWDEFMGLGRMNPADKGERFCMSTFLCKTCYDVNGVSWLHGKVSQKMFAGIWPGYFPEESHVGYVTNGVHLPTWAASEWKAFYEEHFGKDFYKDMSNEEVWKAVYDVPGVEIWNIRMKLKQKLVDYIRARFRENWLRNQGDPSRVVSLLDKINPNALLIGFGRRFATYKRAHLLFNDLERLKKIVNNPDYPVQFIYAGKAHPADGAGQGLIKRIYEISQMPEFLGKVVLLENYDMELGRRLISGVDIWMNTPTRPLEASGTSGEKALMNGLLNLSVLDGWWLEGYRKGAGWALTEKRTYQNQDHQDQLDASTIYNIIEREIIPLYYQRNEEGYPHGWVKAIKNSIAQIAPHYTMKRQLDDYYEKFYNKEAARFKMLSANANEKAFELAAWKEQVRAVWDGIEVTDISIDSQIIDEPLESGKKYETIISIDEKGLNDAVGVELVLSRMDEKGESQIYKVCPLNVVKREGNIFTFSMQNSIDEAGTFNAAYRIYPKHPLLNYRQEFSLVKWFVCQ